MWRNSQYDVLVDFIIKEQPFGLEHWKKGQKTREKGVESGIKLYFVTEKSTVAKEGVFGNCRSQ